LWSQEPIQKYDFVSIKEGISKVGIYTVIQDDSGFIWLGTNGAGLYRYDGISYESYKYIINDPTSLSSSLVQSSYLDSKNRLWFGTENGLNLYDRENDRFKRIPNEIFKIEEDENITIRSMKEDAHGNLFLGTLDFGLFKMNLDDFTIERVLSNESLESIPLNANAIEVVAPGKVYVATDRGIKLYDYKTNTLRPAVFENEENTLSINNSTESLLVDSQNNLWLGTETDGLIKVPRF
jgi:ligand-binding sensor domain-containing protein